MRLLVHCLLLGLCAAAGPSFDWDYLKNEKFDKYLDEGVKAFARMSTDVAEKSSVFTKLSKSAKLFDLTDLTKEGSKSRKDAFLLEKKKVRCDEYSPSTSSKCPFWCSIDEKGACSESSGDVPLLEDLAETLDKITDIVDIKQKVEKWIPDERTYLNFEKEELKTVKAWEKFSLLKRSINAAAKANGLDKYVKLAKVCAKNILSGPFMTLPEECRVKLCEVVQEQMPYDRVLGTTGGPSRACGKIKTDFVCQEMGDIIKVCKRMAEEEPANKGIIEKVGFMGECLRDEGANGRGLLVTGKSCGWKWASGKAFPEPSSFISANEDAGYYKKGVCTMHITAGELPAWGANLAKEVAEYVKKGGVDLDIRQEGTGQEDSRAQTWHLVKMKKDMNCVDDAEVQLAIEAIKELVGAPVGARRLQEGDVSVVVRNTLGEDVVPLCNAAGSTCSLCQVGNDPSNPLTRWTGTACVATKYGARKACEKKRGKVWAWTCSPQDKCDAEIRFQIKKEAPGAADDESMGVLG